ncbi:hypothetical protein HF086_012225 [Spodoptera exigua]|uniref:Peptidoglycan binding-like domain-containing protein n=1 Tax=Spodoptera exigua TaxID=7107 RepID=A0A922MDT9_SPOEX|nr:hypothetical protein HF086_012225 [Spodoptera exigua]
MIVRSVLCILSLLCCTCVTAKAVYYEEKPPTPEELTFLKKYGYLSAPDDLGVGDEADYAYTPHSISDALKKMQAFAGLPETGTLDPETKQLFKKKRCGVKDIETSTASSRSRRVVNGSSTMNKSRVEEWMEVGLGIWAPHGDLRFSRIEEGRADIQVSFVSGDHGDGLSTSFYLFSVKDQETSGESTEGPVSQTSLVPRFTKAGSEEDENYMPDLCRRYWMFDSSFHFIKQGSISEYLIPKEVTELTTVFLSNYNNKTYLIEEERYWRFDEGTGTMDPKYPKDMSMWRQVPYPVDAAVVWKGDTYFFQGPRFWRFDNELVQAHEYYPLPTAQVWFKCNSTSEMDQYITNDGP